MGADPEISRGQLEKAARAALRDLGDIPVDDVLGLIDQTTPGYRRLYYRWEHQQWEAGAIDFTEDRRQWAHDFAPEMRRSFLWALSSFYVGEQQVTAALVSFVDAAPTEEQQVFLTSQLADEARHRVFLDRFYNEVLEDQGSDMNARSEGHASRSISAPRILLLEMLSESAERIRRERDPGSLVEGIFLYHVVIEATLALTGQRFLLNYAHTEGLLPGFRQGLTAVARDEARHVGFGVRFLREVAANDASHALVIQAALERLLPIAMSVFEPSNGDPSHVERLPYGPEDMSAFAMNGLSKRLRAIGVAMPA